MNVRYRRFVQNHCRIVNHICPTTMKNKSSCFRPSNRCGMLLGVIVALAAFHSTLSAADKVRIFVEAVQGKTAPGEKSATTPKAPADKGRKETTPKATGFDPYTHTTSKALTVSLANMTQEPLEALSVKCTFLARAEPKHEIVTEKQVEQKVTLAPGKSDKFTTEEVSYSHTTAHRPAPQKGGAAGQAGKTSGAKAPAMEPASGHSYAGWKVEVYQGNDLIGTASGQN
jgi:hypothetical protein